MVTREDCVEGDTSSFAFWDWSRSYMSAVTRADAMLEGPRFLASLAPDMEPRDAIAFGRAIDDRQAGVEGDPGVGSKTDPFLPRKQ